MDCICPYCDKPMEDPDECYETDRTYEHECPNCEKTFVFEVDYIRTYSTHKANCLNGGEHDWKKTITFPPSAARLRCTMCTQEKPLEA